MYGFSHYSLFIIKALSFLFFNSGNNVCVCVCVLILYRLVNIYSLAFRFQFSAL